MHKKKKVRLPPEELDPRIQRDKLKKHLSKFAGMKPGKQGNLPNPYFWFTLDEKKGWMKVFHTHVEVLHDHIYYNTWKEFKNIMLQGREIIPRDNTPKKKQDPNPNANNPNKLLKKNKQKQAAEAVQK